MVAKESKALFSKTKSLRYKHQFNMVEIKISDYRDSPSELDITSVKTEGTVTVTKYRCRLVGLFGNIYLYVRSTFF